MHVIPEQLWNQINVKTWRDLDPHLWMDFRSALMEAETDKEVQGVIVYYTRAYNELFTKLEAQGVNIEFSPVVLSGTTEMVTNIVVSKRDYKSDILALMPYYRRDSGAFTALVDSYDKEFRRAEQELEVVDRNMSLDTAIEKLYIYERDLAIKSINKLDYRQRREQVVSRNRASFEQSTKETIKNVASSYSNGAVEVNKTDVPGVQEIKFVGTRGIPDNLDGLKRAMEIVIPAHLGVKYTFTFNAWITAKDKTWLDVGRMTWNELSTWKEVS